MQFEKLVFSAVPVMGLLMASCIDDNYDLSDIDTNVRVEVNDLTIPVNIDEVTLKSVFDIEEGDRVQVVNGEYAVVENGEFTSDGVKVDMVTIPSPSVPSSTVSLSTGFGGVQVGSLPVQQIEIPFSTDASSFSSLTTGVSSSIVAIEKVGTDMNIAIEMTLNELKNKVNSFVVRGLKLRLPKGLVLASSQGTYDMATGVYNVGDVTSVGNKVSLKFSVTGIDYEKSNLDYDYESTRISFTDEIGVTDATIVLKPSDFVAGAVLPAQMTVVTDYNISQVEIVSFTGRIKYSIDGTSITDVDLGDLPDVLAQPGTDIRLYNPQIYLSVSNPFEEFGLKANTGLEITAYHDNDDASVYALDAPGYFTIPGVPGKGKYNFCLSPKKVSTPYEGYENAEYVGFASLSNVLSGDGIPKRLGIDLKNPELPEQRVVDFRLGQDFGKVDGRYTFFAPVQLDENSTIVYSDDVDGWGDDDLDDLTINKLSIAVNVTTDIPIEIDFSGYPIDSKGNQINNVVIEGAKVDANANNQRVVITMSGEIKKLDGIHFKAIAKPGKDGGVLRPGMNIRLSDVRATVDGYYEKEL